MAAIEIVDLPTKWWIVMPFCDGESLFELVDVSGPQPEPTAQHLMRQASEGLAFLHDSHLAHLDISPENILVTRAHHVWVTDFGAATPVAAGELLERYRVGKLSTMAPEVWAGEAPYDGKKADVWSLGICLYFLAARSYPVSMAGPRPTDRFVGYASQEPDNPALVQRALRHWIGAGSIPALSDGLIDLLSHMLLVDPAARFSMADVLAHPWLSAEAPAAAAAAAAPPVAAAAAAAPDAAAAAAASAFAAAAAAAPAFAAAAAAAAPVAASAAAAPAR